MARPGFDIRVKRIYDPAEEGDGTRVLVDRLWPRGLTRSDAALDLWLKAIAPSHELRRWFHASAGQWEEFRRRYEDELSDSPEAVVELRWRCAEGPVTLLFAARDVARNHALILKDLLEREGGP
jgi:uncharacterized protein YeaO (DUF488 family)